MGHLKSAVTHRPPKDFFSYPDLVVVRGEWGYHDEHRDALLNPTLILKVLSD